MKAKNIKRYVYLTIGLFVISLIVGIIISINTKFPVGDLEIVADVSEDGYFYLMSTASADTRVIKVDTNGKIIDQNIMKVKNLFSKYIVEYEGSTIKELDGDVYCVRRWIDDTTMQIVKKEVVQLDPDNISAKPIVLCEYNLPLPNIDNISFSDDRLYVAMISQTGDKAYVDEIDLGVENKSEKIRRIINISSPLGDNFNNTIFDKHNGLIMLTKGGKVYKYVDEEGNKLIYPESVRSDKYISLLTTGFNNVALLYGENIQELYYYHTDVGIRNLYSGINDIEKKIFDKAFGNKLYNPLSVSYSNNKNIAILVINNESEDDEMQLDAIVNGQIISFDTIKFSAKVMIYESLKKAFEIFLISLAVMVTLILIVYIIKRGKKIIYKFILVLIPILVISFAILAYNQIGNQQTVIEDLKKANAITVNHATLNNIDSKLVRELRDNRDAYLNGQYNTLLGKIQVFSGSKDKFNDNSDQFLSNNKVAGVDENYIFNEIFLLKDGQIYTGVSQKVGYMEPINLEYFEGTKALLNKAIKTGEPVMGNIASKMYRAGVYATPIIDDNEIVGILATTFDIYTINKFTTDSIYSYVKAAALLLLVVSIPIYFMFKIVLKPLKELGRAVSELANGNYSVRMVDTTNDEFSYIRAVFNKMCDQLNGSIYRVNNIGQSYFRFVPRHIFSILGKNDILDIQLGDNRQMTCIVVSQSLFNFYEIEKKIVLENSDNLLDIMNIVNKYFKIVYNSLENKNGALISNDLKLQHIDAIFQSHGNNAIEYGIDVIKTLAADEILNEVMPLNNMILIYKTNIMYGIAGEVERVFPFVLSLEKEQMDQMLPKFESSGAKVIITEEIKNELNDTVEMDIRYIGYIKLKGTNQKVRMHEVLNGCDITIHQQKQSTSALFQNALDLFYMNEFYMARNAFSNVVEQSPSDNIARWYMFLADKYCKHPVEKEDYIYDLYGDDSIKLP